MMKKRSVTVNRKATSVSLEDPFWSALHELAEAKGMTIADLVSEIDKTRGAHNLSSALRLAVLAMYRA